MPVRSWAICMLPSCHPPPTLSSFLLLLLFCRAILTFTDSLSFVLTFSLHLSVPHFLSAYPRCCSPFWPLAATVNRLHEVESVRSSVPYVRWRPLDTLAHSLTAWFGPRVAQSRGLVNLHNKAILSGFSMFVLMSWVQTEDDDVKGYHQNSV